MLHIYPEFKKIAGMNAAIERLAEKVLMKMDVDGLDFKNAYLIDGCKEKGGHLIQGGVALDNVGLVDDLYYCDQSTGYCEDDFYGTLYFKTNVPGQFVAVPFEM